MNGHKIFKSEVVKKTLAPVWNEAFDTSVKSRVADQFVITVYDWDRVGTATPLGKATVNLADLEPFSQSNLELPLTPLLPPDKKGSKEPGVVRLKITFKPAFLVRTRQATSTFGGAGRVGTSLAGGVEKGLLGVGGAGVKVRLSLSFLFLSS